MPDIPRLNIDPDTRKSIYIVALFAFGVIGLLSLFDSAGALGTYLNSGMNFLFGWGKIFMPIILILLAFFLFNEDKYEVSGSNYLGLFLFLFSFHSLLNLIFIQEDLWNEAIKNGEGGGYIGMITASAFIKLIGFWGALIALFCILIVSLILIFRTTLRGIFGREGFLGKLFYPVEYIFSLFSRSGKEEDEEFEEKEDEVEEEDEKDEEEKEEEVEDEEMSEENLGFNLKKVKEVKVDDEIQKKKNKEDKIIDNFWKPTGLIINLPLDLLSNKIGKPTSGDIKNNIDIIKRTMENFSIPVDMGEVTVGPTVTQYTFKPAEGVRLSKITTLNNNLALALSNHPLRIEAPIPGKALVGIEVPNRSKAIVGLREMLSNREFIERKSNLTVAIGKDVSGKVWLYDISKMPHLLVAGATNSGKSVCLNSLIVSLLYQNNPDDIKFIMVDPKRVELTPYNGIPYLLTPVITDVSKTINALKWCLNEMDRRLDLLSKKGKKNIQSYNESASIKMPYIIFVIDELADLMVAAARDVEAGIIRLAQMARAVGIHLILATQRPSVDVITGLIKANMPARIAFSVASGIDSRTILDSPGAEKLLGRGDMLFTTAEIFKPKRIQGAYLSEGEIKKIVRYIKDRSGEVKYIDEIVERQKKVRGIGGVGLDGSMDDEDDLLLEAKEIIINSGKASASLLQRRLSIGYARAARLLDILEANGVIGPSNGAKAREILINKEQYEKIEEQGVSGVNLHNRAESTPPDEYLDNEDDESDENNDEDEEDLEDNNEDSNDEDKNNPFNDESSKRNQDEEDSVIDMIKEKKEKKEKELKEDKNKVKKVEDFDKYFSR